MRETNKNIYSVKIYFWDFDDCSGRLDEWFFVDLCFVWMLESIILWTDFVYFGEIKCALGLVTFQSKINLIPPTQKYASTATIHFYKWKSDSFKTNSEYNWKSFIKRELSSIRKRTIEFANTKYHVLLMQLLDTVDWRGKRLFSIVIFVEKETNGNYRNDWMGKGVCSARAAISGQGACPIAFLIKNYGNLFYGFRCLLLICVWLIYLCNYFAGLWLFYWGVSLQRGGR